MNKKSIAIAVFSIGSLIFVWLWFYVKSVSHGEQLMKILPAAANIEIVHQVDSSASVPLNPWCNDIRYNQVDRQNLCQSPVKITEFTAAAQCKPATVFLKYRLFPFTKLQATIFTQGDASGLEKAFQAPPEYMALPNNTALPRAPSDKLSRSDANYLKASSPRQVSHQDCGVFQVYKFNF